MERLAQVTYQERDAAVLALGIHLLCEMWECDREALNRRRYLVRALTEAVRAAGGTLLGIKSHAFKPHGVSAVALLGESHMSIHTWPELGYAAVDIFTCGPSMDPYRGLELLKEAVGARRMSVQEVRRGPGTGRLH
ncbi:MAG: adenosylmethionine decarboxylase [Dehalococcoidia bacterium]|nr:adenosylmethionine decarboxylase [Dehalococcoidia bacterium]MDW8008779.1 adenosylmethionine decarboxylase [Chloroflexota bacterium]